MLKLIGAPKLVEIRRIHIDGAAPVDMEKENVRDIERSIVENGNTVINPSWVDKKTSRIVQGRDRILAQMRFRKCALVQYVSGTEEEYARIQIEENLCRRHDDKGVLRSKLVDLLSPSLAQEAIKAKDVALITPDSKRKAGRPSTGKTAAIQELAKQEGVSPQAVRSSITRAKKKAAAETNEPDPETNDDDREAPEERKPVPAPKVSCLRTLGLEINDLVEDAARDEQKRVDRMARALAEFGAALTDHRKEQAGLNTQVYLIAEYILYNNRFIGSLVQLFLGLFHNRRYLFKSYRGIDNRNSLNLYPLIRADIFHSIDFIFLRGCPIIPGRGRGGSLYDEPIFIPLIDLFQHLCPIIHGHEERLIRHKYSENSVII